MELDPKLALQVRVSKMLGLGFAFSLVPAGGVGSLIAVFIGIRARGVIKRAGGGVVGMRMAWWCIIVGLFRLSLTIALLVPVQFLKAFNK
jgi:hypothetical protein